MYSILILVESACIDFILICMVVGTNGIIEESKILFVYLAHYCEGLRKLLQYRASEKGSLSAISPVLQLTEDLIREDRHETIRTVK